MTLFISNLFQLLYVLSKIVWKIRPKSLAFEDLIDLILTDSILMKTVYRLNRNGEQVSFRLSCKPCNVSIIFHDWICTLSQISFISVKLGRGTRRIAAELIIISCQPPKISPRYLVVEMLIWPRRRYFTRRERERERITGTSHANRVTTTESCGINRAVRKFPRKIEKQPKLGPRHPRFN